MARIQKLTTFLDQDGKPTSTIGYVGNTPGDTNMRTFEVPVLPLDTYDVRLTAAEAAAENEYEA